jgi:hypothetical protein
VGHFPNGLGEAVLVHYEEHGLWDVIMALLLQAQAVGC